MPFESVNLEEIRKALRVPPKRFAGSEDSGGGTNPDRCGDEWAFYGIEAIHILTLHEDRRSCGAFCLFTLELSETGSLGEPNAAVNGYSRVKRLRRMMAVS